VALSEMPFGFGCGATRGQVDSFDVSIAVYGSKARCYLVQRTQHFERYRPHALVRFMLFRVHAASSRFARPDKIAMPVLSAPSFCPAVPKCSAW